ncbi:phospholipase-like protein [Tanacetum coccineum]
MLQKQKVSDNDHYYLPLIYNVNGHTLHFGRDEFCLISGFKFRWISFCNIREGDITFLDRVFPEKIRECVKNIDLLSLIEDECRFSNLSDSDSIRVCLLLSLEVIFIGHELGSSVDDVFLRMVEDLDVWNDFPWGEHMWRELYGAIRNVTSNHKQEHHKALEKNPNFVSTYSLSGFLLSFKIWILESSCVTDRWWSKLSEEIPRGSRTLREKDGKAESGCQTSTKEVSLKDRVKALEGLCDSLIILPKEIKRLKARVYKLETFINVITQTKKDSNMKHKDKLKSVKQCDVGDKYWSDQDGEFFTNIVSPNPSANKDVVNELVDALDDLVDENGVVEVEKDLSPDAGLKVQKLDAEKKGWQSRGDSDKCGTNKRRHVNVLRPPMEEDTDVKVLSIDILKKGVKISNHGGGRGEEDLNRPFKCIDNVYCNSVLEQFLITSGWRHCKFPWCNEIVVDRSFLDSLIGLDDDRLGWLLDDVFIPINEPKRHWYLVQFHIQSGNVTFYDSQKTNDVEYHPWYVKMRSCLKSKLPVLLHRTGVLSKGIDPTSYSIKFSQAQNVPKQGGVFGDCGVFVCLFLYRLAYGILLDVEDPIQTALAYREKMTKFFFEHKIICPS